MLEARHDPWLILNVVRASSRTTQAQRSVGGSSSFACGPSLRSGLPPFNSLPLLQRVALQHLDCPIHLLAEDDLRWGFNAYCNTERRREPVVVEGAVV